MRNVTFLDFSNPLPHRSGGGATLHIGALYIVSSLEQNQYIVDYRDYQTSEYCDSLKLEDMLKFAANAADIVLISCMSYMLPLIVLFSERFKAANPDKIIVLGGPGPSGVAEDLVRAFPFIDYVTRGEGEEIIPLLLKTIEEGKSAAELPGVVFMADRVYSLPPKRIKDLDSIAPPAYHAVDMTKYTTFGIITGRGCVYRCKFCDVHGLWGDQYYRRSIERVLDEIEELHRNYGVQRFDIWDDTFIVDRKRVMAFVNGLHDRKLDVHWSCFGRINLIDEELLKVMKEAGCDDIFYGLESGSQFVLDKIDKKINLSDVCRVIELSLRYMRVSAHLIWGFPFETIEDLYRTFFMYNYLKGTMRIGLGQLWPLPTSPLHYEYHNLLAENTSQIEFYKILPFPTQNSEEEQLIHGLVRQHPHIFTQFCIFADESFFQKREIIERLLLFCGDE